MRAYLVLEDGNVFVGKARGAFKETVCELAFTTSMTGYTETLSDPSYTGQGLIMTYPIIGNYGVNKSDFESSKLHVSALIVHSLCNTPSNFRSENTLENILREYKIPCIEDVDTRAIVRLLREKGTQRCVLTSDISDKEALLKKIQTYDNSAAVEKVSRKEKVTYGKENSGPHIALLDFGTKKSMARCLVKRGAKVTVLPHNTSAENILSGGYDAVLLSNGPSDPAERKREIAEIGKLMTAGIPLMGICFGHQLLALSQGAKTEKMKYGHRGGNHPAKYIENNRTYITAQNHGYVVTKDSLPSGATALFTNVNDKSIEGIAYSGKPAFSVQFHPEASGGPHDTMFLFDTFLEMIERGSL